MLAIFSPTIAESSLLTKPFNGYVNKAVSNTIVQKLKTMGFAANDPIYGVTLAAAETTIAVATVGGSVAATVGAIGSAPVWLSVALGLGAAYEIYDFAMGQYDFRATSPSSQVRVTTGTVVMSVPPPPAPSPADFSSPITALPLDYSNPGVGVRIEYPSDLLLCATSAGRTVCGSSAQSVRDQAYTYFHAGLVSSNNGTFELATSFVTYTWVGFSLISSAGPTKITCAFSLTCPEGVNYTFKETYKVTRSAYYFCGGKAGCSGDPMTQTEQTTVQLDYVIFNNQKYVDPNKSYSLNDAVSKLGTADLTQRADPELLAALANKIWQQAAQQPGYAGAPYDPANPVTAADVLADIAAGIYPHPTVADLLTLVSPNAQTAPRLDPTAIPVEATDAATTVNVDFGPNPGIAQPALEEAPTGTTIVAQIMGLLPSLSGFTMPAHTSECTAPTFTFFNSTQTMQPMCDLLEQQRVLLSTIFSAMWGVVSLAMVLKA